MRKNLLYSAAILLALSSQALADGAPSAQGQPADAKASATELPLTSASQGAMQASEKGGAQPDTGTTSAASTEAAQQRGFASGTWCVGYFGSKTFRLRAWGTVTYTVVPTTFFNATMRVTYVGLRTFNVNRYPAPYVESIRISGPLVTWPVNVTIRGYGGQPGCFRVFAG